MRDLYPLKFKPIFKDKIWGGQKIRQVLNMDYSPLPNCGEVWVLSGVENNQSVVEEGFLKGNDLNELMEVYMGDLVGDKIYQQFGNEFPILVKFIDASDWLSIQVHPDDILARKRHQSSGKTEMWYILAADKDAELIAGFSKKVDKKSYQDHLENKTLKSIMNFEKVNRGDVFFTPAGRVHALGPGILLAEIQQTSDVTYRIYDWDRIDQAGIIRELHTELALDAIDFNLYDNYKISYPKKVNETVNLVECPYFTTNVIELNKGLKKDYSQLDSFVILIAVEGAFKMKCGYSEYGIKFGESLLLPATIDNIEIYPETKTRILEVYMVI